MKNYYQISNLINISSVDVNYNLRFDHILNYFQDVTTTHSYELKVDRETMMKDSNAFWVLTKIKLQVEKLPKWNEEVAIKTYPTTVSPVRFFREFSITSTSGAKVIAKSEWCVLDGTTKTLRRSNSINYPVDMEHLPPNPEIVDFAKIKEEISIINYFYSYKIMYADLDCNNHTNNVVYAKMMINAFTPEEYSSLNIKGIEINFLNQSYYGDTVDVYKKKCDNGYYIEGKIQDKTIFTSKLYI